MPRHRQLFYRPLLTLRDHVAVNDLWEVVVSDIAASSDPNTEDLPSATDCIEEIAGNLRGKRTAVFLDYDGTLAPIVDHPDRAVLSETMRNTVGELARRCVVAIVSGRDLDDVKRLVRLQEIFYAGSHGFEIAGPKDSPLKKEQATELLPLLDSAEKELRERLGKIAGALVERKKFSVAVHYRNVREGSERVVEDAVDQLLARHPELRKLCGKKVYDVQPRVDWDKGKTVLWLLENLGLNRPDVLPIYIGDDVTDEDAFRALAAGGVAIVVRNGPRRTAARYALENVDQVRHFLQMLTSILEKDSR